MILKRMTFLYNLMLYTQACCETDKPIKLNLLSQTFSEQNITQQDQYKGKIHLSFPFPEYFEKGAQVTITCI